MSDNTKIEWTRPPWVSAGATWNPVTGCSKVSDSCKHCYAERDWKRLSANPKATKYYGRAFTDVQCHPEVLDQPLRWKKPRGIFVNSMSDLFHEAVPADFIAQVFDVIDKASQHTFFVLTKRADRMRDFVETVGAFAGRDVAPRNLWLGVTVENQAAAYERIPLLLQTPAARRFVSCEPLLGPVYLNTIGLGDLVFHDALTGESTVLHDGGIDEPDIGKLDWVIAGGESGHHARPSHPDWFRSLRDQCHRTSTPFYFKQWGEWCGDIDCAPLTAPEQADPGEYFCEHRFGDRDIDEAVYRTGKKRAGRTLDGREWSEFPGEVV